MRTIRVKALLISAGTLMLPVLAEAKLSFQQTSVSVKSAGESKHLTSKFRFTNAGDQPVYVLNVTTSCGCLVAVTDKKHYAAGEAGEVEVTYSVGTSDGPQSQTVSLLTNEQSGNFYVLTFNAELPRALTANLPPVTPVSPTALFWTRKPFGTKTVTVDLGAANGADFTVTSDAGEAFLIEKERPAGERVAKVKITPGGAVGEARGELTITLKTGEGGSAQYKVRLHALETKASPSP